MVILDANVLIAFFRIEEKQHEEAQRILEQKTDFVINDHILGEIFTVLMLRESYQIAKDAVNWITKNTKIRVKYLDRDDIKQIVAFVQLNQNMKLSFADMTLLVQSINSNYELVTFDKELEKTYLNLK